MYLVNKDYYKGCVRTRYVNNLLQIACSRVVWALNGQCVWVKTGIESQRSTPQALSAVHSRKLDQRCSFVVDEWRLPEVGGGGDGPGHKQDVSAAGARLRVAD